MEDEYRIDLSRIYSVDEFQDVLRESLPMPEYYGGTLDALYDVLSDEGRDWRITFSGMVEAEAILGRYIRSFRRMCERVNSEAEDKRIILKD